MLRRLGHLLVLIALIEIAGGHWAVLQTVAWTGMAIDYSRSYGVASGLVRTFDGAHPCPLCLEVKQGRQDEQKQAPKEIDFKLAKIQLFSPHDSFAVTLPVPISRAAWFSVPFRFSARSAAPLTPPPRAALS